MAQTITMAIKELTKYEVISRLVRREINGTEATKQLNLLVRQVKRLKRKFIEKGAVGLAHGNRGKTGNRRIPEARIKRIEKIVKRKAIFFII